MHGHIFTVNILSACFFSIMDEVVENIKHNISDLTPEKLEEIRKLLEVDCGVKELEDCKYVLEEDLSPLLTKIQARRLIGVWSGKCTLPMFYIHVILNYRSKANYAFMKALRIDFYETRVIYKI